MENQKSLYEKRFDKFVKMLTEMSKYTGSYSTVHSERFLKDMLEDDLENHSDFKKTFNEVLQKNSNPKTVAKQLIQHDFEAVRSWLFMVRVLDEQKTRAIIRGLWDEDCFETLSDAGSLKVGGGGMTALISNHVGDGTNECGITSDDSQSWKLDTLMEQADVTLRGDIDIYTYDCGSNVLKTISGDFFVYIYDNMFTFVRW